MNKVTVHWPKTGLTKTFKSPYRCDDVKVGQLPTTYRLSVVNDDVPFETLVHDHVGATIHHERIDGRKKEYKHLRYYTVRYLFESF